MTQDQIIQMLHNVVAENQNFTTWTVSTPHLVALVHHAIAEEREACAKVADGYVGADPIADAIRARGQA
jgi:hypothetical protein